ncbi:MAG: twin-arginine translocase TatA/TatE family subunit [Anaerolineae bacterium]|jgi:sec-independent protein translocase protein TatA|nr:twin-arginine translocase TatA/TatE family subunit [Anaerolineae bacterium]
MFNLGGWEWAILLVIVLIVFGVGKLPQIGGAIGQSIREFREASKEDPKDAAATAASTTEAPKQDEQAS